MPTLPRACPAGDYTCGALAHNGLRYCHDHEHLEPHTRRRRRRPSTISTLQQELCADA